MLTIRNCVDPKGAWEIVEELVTVLLLIEGPAHAAQAMLIGDLHLLAMRMSRCGHPLTAIQIRELLDVVALGDLAQGSAREYIRKKHQELNPRLKPQYPRLTLVNSPST